MAPARIIEPGRVKLRVLLILRRYHDSRIWQSIGMCNSMPYCSFFFFAASLCSEKQTLRASPAEEVLKLQKCTEMRKTPPCWSIGHWPMTLCNNSGTKNSCQSAVSLEPSLDTARKLWARPQTWRTQFFFLLSFPFLFLYATTKRF